jgi:hypothetical protein
LVLCLPFRSTLLYLQQNPAFRLSQILYSMAIVPSTPSAGNSPASDESSNLPRTPVSPSNMTLVNPASPDHNQAQQQQQQNGASTQMKRKPSRRANTAERRATHNAVERQRRETLNGRFLVCSRCSQCRFPPSDIYIFLFRTWPLCCLIFLRSAVPPNHPSSTPPSPTSTHPAVIASSLPANSDSSNSKPTLSVVNSTNGVTALLFPA